MEIEPLPSSHPRISPRKACMKSSILPSSPLRFETDLTRHTEEENVEKDDSPPLLLRCDFDRAIPNEEVNKISAYPSFLDSDFNSVGAGLQNGGNTCYLNSVLQCIVHSVPLVEKLLSTDHHHPDSGDDNDFCSFCALRRLVGVCMANSRGSIAPSDFTNNLRKISRDFCLGEQEDAHEFLLCLLDNLHKCCLDPGSKNQASFIDKDSLVKHVYGGRSISQLRCSKCGHCSNTPEPLLDLSLEITDASTLTDALESFTKVEKIEETKFTCEGCKSQVLMEKQTKIDQAPAVISLHLKRFRNNGMRITKIDKFVEYPLELDLRPFISCPNDEEQTIYDLYAVLVHQGVASFGHYYSLIRSSPTAWYSMDDSKVNRVSETDVLNEMAYILFYIKRDSSPWFSSLMEAYTGRNDSPISVLNHMGGILSPSSAEETSSSGSRETPEKEPDPLPEVSPRYATSRPEFRDHSPSTSYTCDDILSPKELHSVVTSRFQAQHTKRPHGDHLVLNMEDIFHDEPLEEEKENDLTPQVNIGRKRNREVKMPVTNRINEPLKRLVKGMPSSRRSGLLACLPPEAKCVSKKSPLVSKTQPLNKKRRTMLFQ